MLVSQISDTESGLHVKQSILKTRGQRALTVTRVHKQIRRVWISREICFMWISHAAILPVYYNQIDIRLELVRNK